MNYHPTTKEPLINGAAFFRALGMWTVLWGGTVAFIVWQGQPGVICLTPMAWLLAVPGGLNYVAFANGRPGRSPFLAGALLGAFMGVLFGLLFWGISAYTMPDDPAGSGTLTGLQLSLIMMGIGVVVEALLGGLMAHRAASLQRRGRTISAVTVQ